MSSLAIDASSSVYPQAQFLNWVYLTLADNQNLQNGQGLVTDPLQNPPQVSELFLIFQCRNCVCLIDLKSQLIHFEDFEEHCKVPGEAGLRTTHDQIGYED